MVTILFRTFIMYITLLLTVRFMGKRQLGELEVSELVTTLLLSEVAALPLTEQDIPLSFALLPIAVLASTEVLLSGLLLRVPGLKRLLSGRPAILIRDGKPDRQAMKDSRISAEELMSQLRLKDVTDPGTVRYAIAEPNGQLSIVLKASERQPTTRELGVTPSDAGIMHLIISEGIINENSLAQSGHDMAWLESCLRSHRLRARDVFLLLADDGGKIRLYPRTGA